MTDIQPLEASHDFYLEGRERMDAGDLNLAVVAFEASIAAYPHFKALELLGECHMRLRNYKSAIVPLAAATTLNRQSRAPSLLAEAFERLGEFSDAREFAQLALLRARENRRARDVLARVGTDFTLRHASESDIPWLQRLIEESARALSLGHYTPLQIESAIRYVFGVDSMLIADGTYFLVNDGDAFVACGGWSRRRTLYGGDQRPVGAADLLDPASEAARIRAFFVAPSHARRGIGRMLVGACTVAAETAGFRRLELMATLPGVPLYRACGFTECDRMTDVLPDGTAIEFVRMERRIEG
jgi:N-acetylglutamate synthase-like GNAT family acetyltransferase